MNYRFEYTPEELERLRKARRKGALLGGVGSAVLTAPSHLAGALAGAPLWAHGPAVLGHVINAGIGAGIGHGVASLRIRNARDKAKDESVRALAAKQQAAPAAALSEFIALGEEFVQSFVDWDAQDMSWAQKKMKQPINPAFNPKPKPYVPTSSLQRQATSDDAFLRKAMTGR